MAPNLERVSLHRVADELSKSPLADAGDPLTTLRIMGLAGDVTTPLPVLRVLSNLSLQFAALQLDFPALQPWLQCFQFAQIYLDALTPLYGGKVGQFSSRFDGLAPRLASAVQRHAEIGSWGQVSLRDDWLACTWLSWVLEEHRQNRKATNRSTIDGLNVWNEIADFERRQQKKKVETQRYRPLADMGFDDWAVSVRGLSVAYGLVHLPAEVERIRGALGAEDNRSITLLRYQSCPSLPKPAPFDQAERSLSTGHVEFPRPEQLVALRSLLTNNAGSGEVDHNAIESLIVALAFVAGATIEEVLHVQIVGYLDDGETYIEPTIDFEVHAESADVRSFKARWHVPTGEDGECLTLPLPERIGQAVKTLVGFHRRGRLWELLPFSPINWSGRAQAFLQQLLGEPPAKASRMSRDTFARLVYAESGNNALAASLSPFRDSRRNSRAGARPVLSYYLNPRGLRTYETFCRACDQLFPERVDEFNTHVARKNFCAHGNYRVSIKQHRCIATELRRNVAQAEDWVQAHNAYARYALLMLIVGTGHRPSRTPFYFAWDLQVEERIAFVCDKIVVGSEARFVPLADSLADLVSGWYRHLRAVHRLARECGEVASHIERVLGLDSSASISLSSRKSAAEPAFGCFFTINADYSICTLDSHSLQGAIQIATEGVTISRLRSALADALWGFGLSGWDVNAFLGHSNELHPFGPESTWSVTQWSNRVRPFLQQYLDERGWLAMESPLAEPSGDHKQNYRCATPGFSISGMSYEGRSSAKRLARERARSVVRQVLSTELVLDRKQIIDEKRTKRVLARVDQTLGADRCARDSVRQVLESELGAMRRDSSTAAMLNLVRISPSPVAVPFGRHYAIARQFRDDWIRRVGLGIGGQLDVSERLAQLAVSLVVFDAMLDPSRIERMLIGLIERTGLTCVSDLVVLRGDVCSDRFEYDYVVACSDLSASQCIGIARDLKAVVRNGATPLIDFKELRGRISAIVAKVLGFRLPTAQAGIDTLCAIFRPWWFVRLSGAMYSVAMADHVGPAPHPISAQSLLGECGTSFTGVAPLKARAVPVRASPDQERAEALRAIGGLISRARGRMSEGTNNTRAQREKLAQELFASESNACLQRWMQDQPIVDAVVGFIDHLLIYGGPQKDVLRFISIATYRSRVVPALVEEGWDQEIEDWDEEDYELFYERVLARLKGKRTDSQFLLLIFHQYLRSTLGAPYVSTFPNLANVPQRCRSTLITIPDRNTARELLTKPSFVSGHVTEVAQALLGLGCDYGLRSAEASGLRVTDFDAHDSAFLSVVRNVTRDIKTPSGRRVIHHPCPWPETTKVIRAQCARHARGASKNRFVFGSARRGKKLQGCDAGIRAVKGALRAATANSDAVFHDLRGTSGTELALAAHAWLGQQATLDRARRRLVRPDLGDENAIRKLTSVPGQSPFLMDGVARVLGHASVDSLLNFYFRASFILLADQANAANCGMRVNDQQLASMLSRTRTTISKYRDLLRSEDERMPSFESIVRHSIKIFYAESVTPHESGPLPANDEDPVTAHIRWDWWNTVLVRRKVDVLSLDEIKSIAKHDYTLNENSVSRFLSCYSGIVVSIGFDDFEPKASDLISGAPRRGGGIVRGRDERNRSLARADDLWRGNRKFREVLGRVCHLWLERIDPRRPCFVCRSAEELRDLLYVLEMLDTNWTQMEFRYFGSTTDSLYVDITKLWPTVRWNFYTRLSRGPNNVRIPEVGVVVRQLSGAKVPDNRDIHRLFLVLTCACMVHQEKVDGSI